MKGAGRGLGFKGPWPGGKKSLGEDWKKGDFFGHPHKGKPSKD